MKKILTLTRPVILAWMILLSIYALAQNDPTLSSLTPPSAPAYTILGIQPNEISQPKSLNALESSVFSNFTQGYNIILPKNYALEFSPYWFQAHPKLTFKEYSNPGVGQSILQTLSLSLATTLEQNTIDTGINNTRMGIGLRTTIVGGRSPEENAVIMKKAYNLRTNLSGVNGLIGLLKYLQSQNYTDYKAFKLALDSNFALMLKDNNVEAKDNMIFNKSAIVDPVIKQRIADNKDGINKIVKEIISKLDSLLTTKDYEKLLKDLQQSVKERYGFVMEVDGAMELDFPTGSIGYSKVPQWGVWVIPSYRLRDLSFDFLGIVRYIHSEIPGQPANNYDIGAKVVWEAKKFSLATEALLRYQNITLSRTMENGITTTESKSTTDWRLVLNFNYKISNKLGITVNFGKNFNQNTITTGDLIASVGLNFGFGGPTLSSFDQK
jgi:hypothetical protein